MPGDDWLLGIAAAQATAADAEALSDEQRESLILQLSAKRTSLYEAGKKDQARLVQEQITALIAQRSGAYVRKMEHEKGLVSPFCARKPSGRADGGHA